MNDLLEVAGGEAGLAPPGSPLRPLESPECRPARPPPLLAPPASPPPLPRAAPRPRVLPAKPSLSAAPNGTSGSAAPQATGHALPPRTEPSVGTGTGIGALPPTRHSAASSLLPEWPRWALAACASEGWAPGSPGPPRKGPNRSSDRLRASDAVPAIGACDRKGGGAAGPELPELRCRATAPLRVKPPRVHHVGLSEPAVLSVTEIYLGRTRPGSYFT